MNLKARKVNDVFVLCLCEDMDEEQQCEGYEPYTDGWCKHSLDCEGDCNNECNHPNRLDAPTE